jgi:chromate reductase
MKHVLLISGSLRAGSYNTALLKAFETVLLEKATVQWGNIELPLFNEDIEADFPATATVLKEQVAKADAIIIAAPEYNRSMPGVLKNAIDWTSRPYGKNSFAGKRVLVVSVSVGGIAGVMANYELKRVLLHLEAEVMSEPEFLLGNAGEKFDNDGTLTDKQTIGYVAGAVEALLAGI